MDVQSCYMEYCKREENCIVSSSKLCVYRKDQTISTGLVLILEGLNSLMIILIFIHMSEIEEKRHSFIIHMSNVLSVDSISLFLFLRLKRI